MDFTALPKSKTDGGGSEMVSIDTVCLLFAASPELWIDLARQLISTGYVALG